MSLLLLIVLIIILLAVLPTYPYSRRWGYYPSAGVAVIVVILVYMYFAGYLH